ncbi:MAG: nitrate- and nitrite sensing domain-containing protein [Rhodospirillales bacterium]|nr:nitrate- and nitrite sensing domain-containing protein [Rhodospirillales bacterium]
MWHFLENKQIRFRIGLAVFLPLIVLVGLSAYQVNVKLAETRRIDRLSALVDLAPVISSLIHELQKERGMSAGFISSKGAKFADDIPAQRQHSDGALTAVNAAFAGDAAGLSESGLSPFIRDARQGLDQLPAMRKRISSLELPVKDAAAYYTGTIASLLGMIEQLAVVSDQPRVSRAVVAYMALLRAKEAAGLQRAMGAAGFGAGKFEHDVYVRFLAMIARQETYFEQFHRFASDAAQKFLSDTVSGPAVDEVARMQRVAVDSLRTGTTEGIQAGDWFKQITAKIDLLRLAEEFQNNELRQITQELRADARYDFNAILIGATIIALMTIGFALAMARTVTAPISAIVATIRRLSEGDTDVKVVGANRRDEIGAIARALKVFRDNAVEKVRLEGERQETEARNLADRNNAVMEMANRIERETKDSVTHVQDEAKRMAGVSAEMSRLTEQTGVNAQHVAAASNEMLTIAETVAAAAEELAASSDDIRRLASTVGDISRSATGEAQRAAQTISTLVEAANNVGSVLDLIKEIADKTNLLALNATIEAARAGEAGRGFAVVATEVKMLADQTAKATDKINSQVHGMRVASSDSATAIKEVSRVIDEVAQIASDVVSSVEQQREATQEISVNMQQNAQSSREVTERISDVSDAAKASSELAGGVLQTSEALQASVAALRQTINHMTRASAGADRRESERRDVNLPVTVVAGGARVDGRVANISAGGASIAVQGKFSPGEALTLQITGESKPITGKVVTYRPDEARLHVQFDQARAIGADKPAIEDPALKEKNSGNPIARAA